MFDCRYEKQTKDVAVDESVVDLQTLGQVFLEAWPIEMYLCFETSAQRAASTPKGLRKWSELEG